MQDILTLNRIRIESTGNALPFIVVGAPQAMDLRALLTEEGFAFRELAHDFTDDVMFEFDADTDFARLQLLLDKNP